MERGGTGFRARHSTARHSTAHHSTSQHTTAQHNIQHSTAYYSTTQHNTAPTAAQESLPPSLPPSLPSLPPSPGATPPRRASARRTEGPTPRAGSASRMRRVHRRHLSDGPPQEWLPHKTTQGRQLSVVWHPQRMPGCTTTTPPPKTHSRALPSGTLTGWRPQTPPKGAP